VDQGERWYVQPVEEEQEFSVVNSYDDGTVTLAGLKGAYLSRDGGKTWTSVALPKYVSGVYSLTSTPGALWLGTAQGALRSADGGQTWQYMLGGLPKSDVLAVYYDSSGQRLLATALHSHAVFQSKDGGQSWQSTPEAGVSIRTAQNYKVACWSHLSITACCLSKRVTPRRNSDSMRGGIGKGQPSKGQSEHRLAFAFSRGLFGFEEAHL